MNSHASEPISSATVATRNIVKGLWLIRVAAIWLLPTTIISSLIVPASMLLIPLLMDNLSFKTLMNGSVGILLDAVLVLFVLSGVATLLTATIGVFQLTAQTEVEPSRFDWCSARVGTRLWYMSGVLLGVGLFLTDGFPADQGSMLQAVFLKAFVPVLILLAASFSIHVNRLTAGIYSNDTSWPETFRVFPRPLHMFVTRLAATVALGCFAASGATRLYLPSEGGPIQRFIPEIFFACSWMLTLSVVVMAAQAGEELFQLVTKQRSRSGTGESPRRGVVATTV